MRPLIVGPWVRVGAVAMLSMLVAAACSTGATPTPAATTVKVTVQEWSVLPAATSAPAGKITFEVTNSGPEDIHEFVVIKTDLDAFALPTDATGAVDEEGGAMEVLGEIEDIAIGSTQTLALDLAAGHYALICNIYSAEEQEAHYQMGMAANFTVQ